MRCFVLSATAALSLFLVDCADAQRPCAGGCAGGACCVAAQPVVEPEPEWYVLTDGRLGLWCGSRFLGALDVAAGTWQRSSNAPTIDLVQKFDLKRPSARPAADSARRRPDCRPDCPCTGECGDDCPCCRFKDSSTVVDGTLNHGMLWKADGGERCTVNGVAIGRPAMMEALAGKRGGAAEIPDDSQLPRLLILSNNPAIRQKLLSDFHALKDWTGKVIAQGYAPDDWTVTGFYPMPVDPTLYYIDADGLPRGCSKGYTAGAAGMATALAKADKLRNPSGVDPSKAPDLAQPNGPVAPHVAGFTPDQAGVGALALVALGAAAAAYRKKQRSRIPLISADKNVCPTRR